MTAVAESSGMTTRLVLLHVERHAGRRAVDTMLERAGLAGRREELLDEDAWFSYETKIDLFRAACDVLGDPGAMRDIGRMILEVEVGPGLKLALKALGTPRAVYKNVVRANGRFCRSHEMWLISSTDGRVEVGFRDAHGRASALECDYVSGLLSSVPELFGLPPAEVTHRCCAADGAAECVFVATWQRRPALARDAIGWGVSGAVTTGAAALFAPALVPLGAVVLAAGAAHVGRSAWSATLRRQRYLETELADLTDATELLTGSLQDVVGELRLEEVLEKVTANARAAVGGSDFALLLDAGDGTGMRVQSTSAGVDPESHARLEAWVASRPDLLREPQLVDDAAEAGSFCTAPLMVRGEPLGLLVARAPQRHVFLPRDLAVLTGYAAQAAIAVNNARMFEAQQELATSDPLTGLLNRRAFHAELDSALAAASAGSGARPGVVVLDLDGFKAVNDTAGHAAGDRLLRAVAAALHATCRAGDRVCRVGGDEFALLVPDAEPPALQALAARAAEAVDAADTRTAASFGAASFPIDGTTKDELIATADARLYRAKGERAGSGDPGAPLADAVADLLADVLGAAEAEGELRRRRAPDAVLRALERRRRARD